MDKEELVHVIRCFTCNTMCVEPDIDIDFYGFAPTGWSCRQCHNAASYQTMTEKEYDDVFNNDKGKHAG